MIRTWALLLLVCLQTSAQKRDLFVGTYTSGESKGIYVFTFDQKTGELTERSVAENVSNPSFLSLSPNKQFLYASNENGGNEPGEISSFRYDKTSGKLTFINKVASGGDHPCYVTSTGKHVIAGNYTGGNLSVMPVKNGELQPPVQVLQHEGSSINTERQEKAHVHATILSPDKKYLFVPDLGMDEIWIYPYREDAEKPVDENKPVRVKIAEGTGPRHLVFSRNGKFVFVIQELSGTVSSYRFSKGNMKLIQSISSHPSNYLGELGSADIHLSPDGKYLYASNRGNSNTIAIFKVDGGSGKLKLRDIIPTKGLKPRNFAIDPSGNFLLVANQESNTIVVFKRNQSNGSLTYSGMQAKVGNPVCLLFGDQASN